VKFGDTHHVVRDLHRRRPVTPDKHPPSWKLEDLLVWLKVPPQLSVTYQPEEAIGDNNSHLSKKPLLSSKPTTSAKKKKTSVGDEGAAKAQTTTTKKESTGDSVAPASANRAHRASYDARMTWDVLKHTMERYGDDTYTVRQQLITRFFDDESKEEMERKAEQVLTRGTPPQTTKTSAPSTFASRSLDAALDL